MNPFVAIFCFGIAILKTVCLRPKSCAVSRRLVTEYKFIGQCVCVGGGGSGSRKFTKDTKNKTRTWTTRNYELIHVGN